MAQKYYYIVVDQKGKMLLKNSQLPIFWKKSVAHDVSKKFKGTKVLRMSTILFSFPTEVDPPTT